MDTFSNRLESGDIIDSNVHYERHFAVSHHFQLHTVSRIYSAPGTLQENNIGKP